MPFNLGFSELIVLAVVAVLVFGGRLPDVARKLGRTLSEFKRGMNDEMRQLRNDVEPSPPDDWTPPPDGEDCEGLGGP